MEQEIAEKQDLKMQLKTNFSSQQEELVETTKEIDRVQTRLHMTKTELGDIKEVIHREREDLMDRIRDLTREIRLKHLIIDQFIPADQYMKIERRADWSEEINDWVVPNVEFTGNNIKIQKAQQKEGKLGYMSQFMQENIMNMDDSEDEDFEVAATNRVNEAISSILLEEEGDMGEVPAYVPPEKQSVFFRYTDDGAVREDPEDEKNNKKKKSQRQKESARPLTAKKKKTDMVTGDLMNMVSTMGAA